MKKIATVTLLLLLAAVFTLAGCGPSSTTETPSPSPTADAPARENFIKAGDTYRILIWNNGSENDYVLNNQSARAQNIRERWEDYQQQYGITVTYIASPGDNWLSEAQISGAAVDAVCDILHCRGPFTIPLLYGYAGNPGSILTALSDYAEAGDFSDSEYWDVSGQENVGTLGGKLYYAIPLETGFGLVGFNQVTFFNKDILQNSGYTAQDMYTMSEEGNWTFDKLREVAIACTDADRGVYGMHMGQNTCAVFAMVAANGGQYIVNKDGVPTFNANSSNVLEAVDFFIRLAQSDKVVYLEGNPGSDDDHPSFVLGKHALMITYANRAEKMVNDDIHFGIIMPPKGPSASDYISDVNWFTPYCVMNNVSNPAGCVQLISQYIRPEYARSSEESKLIFEAESMVYLEDEGSLETLYMVQDKTVTSPIMSYISVTYNGQGLGYYLFGETNNWIAGNGTPATHYAAVEDAVNELLRSATGMK